MGWSHGPSNGGAAARRRGGAAARRRGGAAARLRGCDRFASTLFTRAHVIAPARANNTRANRVRVKCDRFWQLSGAL